MTIHTSRRAWIQAAGAAGALSLLGSWAHAAPPTSLVVPFTPGASNDVIGRLVADAITHRGNLNWLVENKAGAGSLLGTDYVVKARPDGRTLLLCATANMGILPAIHKGVRYAVDKDFTFLARVASSPFALTVTKALGVSTLDEFVKLAKAKPDTIRLGSSGTGALDYMGASLLQSHFGIKLNIIPYKGMSQVLNDLRAGHIDASIVSPGTIRPFAQDGEVKVLVVFDGKRSPQLPQVPSATDTGNPQLKVVNWWGIAGPARMSAQAVADIEKELMAVLKDPAFTQSVIDKGFDPAVMGRAEFRQFVLPETQEWKALAQRANITME